MNWVTNTYNILSALMMTNVEYLVQSTTYVLYEFFNIDLNSIATSLFLNYIEIKTKVNNMASYVYNNNTYIKKIVDKTSYNYNSAVASYNNHRIEPFNTNWICMSILLLNDTEHIVGNNYTYIEHYQYIKPHINEDISRIQHYNNCLYHLTETAQSLCKSDNVEETMVTMKAGDIIFTKTYNKDLIINEDEQLYLNVQSKVSFISIEYTHPNMQSKIILTIPKNTYFVNNIILSSVFIKRYLEYQSESYVFDDKYVVKLMDNNINMFSLKYNEYIFIKEKTYEVIKNKSN
jgi:hypothetical protein